MCVGFRRPSLSTSTSPVSFKEQESLKNDVKVGITKKRALPSRKPEHVLDTSGSELVNRSTTTTSIDIRNHSHSSSAASLLSRKRQRLGAGCKRVRFREHLHAFSPVACKNREKSDDDSRHSYTTLDWYDTDECTQMHRNAKRAVHEVSQHFRDTTRQLLCVASQCTMRPPPSAYLSVVQLNLPSDALGLEMALLPLGFKKHRREHVKTVLAWHERMSKPKEGVVLDKKQSPDSTTRRVVSEPTVALAKKALISSSSSVLFAKLIAEDLAKSLRKQDDSIE